MHYRILQFTDTGTYTYRIDDPVGTSVYQSATEYLSADEATEMAGEFIAQRLSESSQVPESTHALADNVAGNVIGLDRLRQRRAASRMSMIEQRGLEIFEKIESFRPRFAFECHIDTPLDDTDLQRIQQAGQQLVTGVSNYIGTLIGLLALQYARHPQDMPAQWR